MLQEVLPQEDLLIHLAYATVDNFTGAKVYDHAHYFLHEEAYEKLK